jgi:hypothetical protein
MKKNFLLLLFCLLLQISSIAQSNPGPYLSAGIDLGYNNGLGSQGFLTISNFTQDVPLSIRLGLGYTSVNPGDPVEARSIFINDATNGVPEKSGRVWDFRMDFMLPVQIFSFKKSSLFFGPRYSEFTAEFDFIDGNEFFNINSNQWGVGFGVESDFLITHRMDLVLTTGFDYYFLGIIEGHDTSYGPDGEIINGRKDYTYQDADRAINQPKVVYKAMLGFNYFF